MSTAAKYSKLQRVPPSKESSEEIREQLERIFASDAFQRSRRLQRFLTSITDLTLEGRQEEINEYFIGIEVFGRGQDYNPSEDSVVRRQAHSLRQKLDDYYDLEGNHDPIVIEVPRGHYVPVFRYNDAEPAGAPPEEEPRDLVVRERSGVHPKWLLSAAGLVLAAFLLGRITAGGERTNASTELGSSVPVQELWGPWLSDGEAPLICFSSPYAGLVKHYETPLPSDAAPRRFEMQGDLDAHFRESLGLSGGRLYISPSVTEAKSGEALGAIELAAVFAANGLRPRGILSRLATWEDFRRSNLIVLGHSEQNRWVSPLLENYPLRLEATVGSRPRRIVNTAPAAGERESFAIDYADSEDASTLEYALISMLPGLDGMRQLLLVSGLNTQATRMGIEFLTDPQRAENLLARLRNAAPEHAGPWRFQVVLSAEVYDKTATGGAIELLRVLE